IATIASVAQQLEELGFTATIVSGSSPTDVTVHVDDYAFGVNNPGEKQQIGPLGAVIQRWSELGAASRIDLAVSASSLGVLAVALAASALLLAAVQLASVPGRRAQASVMRTIGWRRRRIVQWMAAEELVSLAVVALAGMAALALTGMRPTVGLVVGASVVALAVTSVLAVALGARPAADGIRLLQLGKRLHRDAELSAWVTSSFRFSVRQLVVHRVGALVQLLATVVVAVSAGAVTVTIIEGRAAAGASALGDFASTQALVSQAGLGLVALVAGIVLAVIARRIDLARRCEQWATMRAMGFSAGQLRMVQLMEGLLIGVPAVAVATAASWFYVGAVAVELRAAILPVALGAAAVLTVILVLTSWREKR
ncbi:MAG TPA: FtsX-like permease family protein, partial [Homoserinimonas sp.]|nr:FtsX-like permease family protein [Homoserinimonas sp.]